MRPAASRVWRGSGAGRRLPGCEPDRAAFQARYPDIALRLTFNDRYVDLVEEKFKPRSAA